MPAGAGEGEDNVAGCPRLTNRPLRSRVSSSASKRPATTPPARCSTRGAECFRPSCRANWTCTVRSAAWYPRRRLGNTSATGPGCRRRRFRRPAWTGPTSAPSRRPAGPAWWGRFSSGSLSARRSATRSACPSLRCITWRATSSRPCSGPTAPAGRYPSRWSRNWSRRASTCGSAPRSTMPSARRSTRSATVSACPSRPAPRSIGWPSSVIRRPVPSGWPRSSPGSWRSRTRD